MSAFSGLDLAGRAELLACRCNTYIRIARSDPRIFANEALPTTDAARRVAAWIAAGEPDVAPDGIAFCGADTVRSIVVATLASFPLPVRWFACAAVTMFEIGRADANGGPAAGYATTLDPRRALDVDRPHVIVLDGRAADDALPSLVSHELAHCLFRPFLPVAPQAVTPQAVRQSAPATSPPQMTNREFDARFLAAMNLDRDAAARLMFRDERWANDAAWLWGHPCEGYWCPDAIRQRLFRKRMDAAADLAVEIAREVDATFAAEDPTTERVAAAVAIEGNS